MRERGFDAIVVMGEAHGNHAMHYITNGAKLTHGHVLKKQGEPPVIICNGMERDEAAKSGLPVVTTAAFDFSRLIKEAGGEFEGSARLLAALLDRYEITRGKVCFYGLGDPGRSYMLLQRLSELAPGITITGETETTIFDEAYLTKDADEVAIIRSVAERTNQVMAEIVAFIQKHTVREDTLVKDGSLPLTVKDVKQYGRARLLHHGLEDAGEMIFAIGRDAGVPHSRGEDDDALVLGKSIIFDLFPRDVEKGYFHDMTRTFCLGYAPPDVQRAYNEVMQAFNAVMGSLEVGREGGYYQELTCDIFEEHGHKTPRSAPGTEEGYVHSLGHGLGLQIHSRPRLSPIGGDRLAVGQVFTVEPGLYYPERGYGVRIEDTVYVKEDGSFESLTPFPKDLVIPVGAPA
jgi:Xaa-Pro aminopeptidase